MNPNKHIAEAETPLPGPTWGALDDRQRLDEVLRRLHACPGQLSAQIEIASVKPDGQIIVRLKQPLSASQRGPVLLDFEAYLKETLDDALVVWLEALGDKNSLRNLRGIEVKA